MKASLNYTTYEVAQVCGVSMPGVIRWINEGKLSAYKTPGGHRRVKREDLMRFMRQYSLPIPEEMSISLNPKILVVDDDPGILHAVGRIIRQWNPSTQVEQAQSGFEAGVKMESFMPDLVLLDIRLPGLDGFQVCESIKRHPQKAHVKVLMMTGNGEAGAQESLKACGADGLLKKPFEALKLKAELSRLLEEP